jgi:uncharacterized membrane protein (DUF2068 family)
MEVPQPPQRSSDVPDSFEPPPGTNPAPRRRRQIDWELIVCGLRGHALIGTDATELRPEDDPIARDRGGVRWHRCLRCDSWVALPTREKPSREYPPAREDIVVPLRGKALRDRIVLRLIAVDRAFHFVVLIALGIGVLLFAAHETSLRSAYYNFLSDIQRGVAGGPVQTSGHVGILHDLDRLFSLRSGRLREVGAALLAYGVLEGVEAVGLWFTKRWAEYLTFVSTTVLLPLEIYEIANRVSVLKIIGFVINVAVVVYLLYAKRLFGLRGGGAVDEELRARAVDWKTIERATPPALDAVG